MKIEHVGLYVEDLERTKVFFETYFDAQAGNLYHNTTTSFQSYFLTFENGARLEIMTREGLNKGSQLRLATGYAHLAFSLGSEEAVDQLAQRLVLDGYELTSGPRRTGDGYYEACILDVEGNQIELTV